MPLSSQQRKHLRGLAHPLEPVVRLGNSGLSEAIISKMDQELESHELIKVKLQDSCTDPAKEIYPLLAEQSRSELVQIIGKIGIFYRKRKKDPAIILPKALKVKAAS